jgi:hypothetical protein
MIKVTVHGPNLSAEMQDQGDLHVHAADCQDNRRYRLYDTQPWTIEVDSLEDIVKDIYPPSDFNYAPADWRGYASDIYIAPCVKLPWDRAHGALPDTTGGRK